MMKSEKQSKLKRLTLVVWLAALVLLFVFCRRSDIRGIRITDYWIDLGTKHDKMETYFHGFVADLLIFIPVGYLIRWQRVTTHWIQMILSVSAIAFSIEILQFVTMHGCIAVSDLVAYHIGGVYGIYLCKLSIYKTLAGEYTLFELLKDDIENIKEYSPLWFGILMLVLSLLVCSALFWVVKKYREVDVFDFFEYLAGAAIGMILEVV